MLILEKIKRKRIDLTYEKELLEYRIQNKFEGYFPSLKDRIWDIRRQLNPLEELEARVQRLNLFIKVIVDLKVRDE